MTFDEEVWALLEMGRGKAPQSYIDYQIMKEMGWTYQELMATPADVVQDIIRYMNTEAKFHQQKAK